MGYRTTRRQMKRKVDPVMREISHEMMTETARALDEMRSALEQSVRLQSHYARLLNDYDGGERMQFRNAGEWLRRLKAIDGVAH